MKPGDRILFLSGFAGTTAVLLASASMTISLVAAASPPVSQYLDAAQNAAMAARVGQYWIPSALNLLLAIWALAQVVVRKPLLTSSKMQRNRKASNSTLIVASGITLLVVIYGFMGEADCIASIRAAGPRPITDNMSFSGMSLGIGSTSMCCSVLSMCLFWRWWQDSRTASASVAADGQ